MVTDETIRYTIFFALLRMSCWSGSNLQQHLSLLL